MPELRGPRARRGFSKSEWVKCLGNGRSVREIPGRRVGPAHEVAPVRTPRGSQAASRNGRAGRAPRPASQRRADSPRADGTGRAGGASRVRHQRGRPPDAWTIAADARPGGSAPRAYQDLGRWLARALRSPRRGLRGIEETGRQIGRELAPEGTASNPAGFEAALTALGFQPTAKLHEDHGVTFCLGNCPYRDAVRENQPAICALHKGITRGLLDVLAPEATLAGFVPRDPDEAGCTIELRGLGASGE